MKLRIPVLKIGAKILLGFAAVGILIVSGTIAGLSASLYLGTQIQNIYQDYLTPEQQMRMIVESVYRIHMALEGSLTGRMTSAQVQNELIQEKFNIQSNLEQLSAAHDESRMKEVWNAYQSALSAAEAELAKNDQAALLKNLQSGEFAKAHNDLLLFSVEVRKERNILGGQILTRAESRMKGIILFLAIAGFVGVVLSQVIGLLVTRLIVRPLQTIRGQLGRLSVGRGVESVALKKIEARGDELGDLARSLNEVDASTQFITAVADQIAAGDLTVKVNPRCEEDHLGIALARMVEQLAGLVTRIGENSTRVEQSSLQLAKAANQTNLATGQITNTIQQMALGLNQQSEEINHAVAAMDKTTLAIDRVARGAGEQGQAVQKTGRETEAMVAAIHQVTGNAQAVVQAALTSSKNAKDGAGTLRQTVSSMEIIGNQVGELAEKMKAVNLRSEEIGSIIETIEEIATKTNILAINATIEAAHAETQARKMSDGILNQAMIALCQMVNQLLLGGADRQSGEFWSRLCKAANLDMVLATDADGVTVLCNDPKLVGFRFSDDPKSQTYPFRQLIRQENGVYCQEAQERSFDSAAYKFVGVTRADMPGIVQVGFNTASLKKYDLRINGFAVVASEVYQLAERARVSAREIRELVKRIQGSVGEAAEAMKRSRLEVETGMRLAGDAGVGLKDILDSVLDVTKQASQAVETAGSMGRLSQSLSLEMQTFERIITDNTGAVQDLNTGYGLITRTMETVSSVSEENSASAEEVSASAEEMRAQMEEVKAAAEDLMRMSTDLHAIVARFQMNGSANAAARIPAVP